jgi:S1-C subfamily serine protease
MRAWVAKRCAAVALMWLIIGVGMDGRLRGSFGAPDTPFWQESRPGDLPTVQAPNFADLAEQLKPTLVNISTTQVIKGPWRGLPGWPFPRPFGEGDPFEEFFERFFGGMRPQRELRRRSLGLQCPLVIYTDLDTSWLLAGFDAGGEFLGTQGNNHG